MIYEMIEKKNISTHFITSQREHRTIQHIIYKDYNNRG